MDDFEEKLRKALERESPSGDFRARVAAKIAKGSVEKSQRTLLWGPHFRWAIAATLIFVTAGIGARYQQQKEREQGEVVKQQALIALRITNEKLQIAQQKVRHLSRP